MSPTLPDAVKQMQPSAGLVYQTLKRADGDCLTVSELIDMTGRKQPTVREAVTDLESAGYVEERFNATDGREKRICLR